MTTPPLGIMPRVIWDEKQAAQRLSDLLSAMERFSLAQVPIPIEWVNELKTTFGLTAKGQEPKAGVQ